MFVIKARNVHQALPEACYQLKTHGVRQASRNGPVLRFPEPCTIVYEKPRERVVLWAERDANPTFHFMESLWMLAGRNDVAFVQQFAKNMELYSDDGATFNGAYGHRWRHHFRGEGDKPGARFRLDQLDTIVAAFKENPDCRRQVLAMWDGHHDLALQSKDLPCNTHAYFSIQDGKLDLMVCNRSNDMIWGALGANAVHFSMLQEYMAVKIGAEVGRYWQTSNNMHLYLDQHEKLMNLLARYAYPGSVYKSSDPYETEQATPFQFDTNVNKFDRDNRMFLDEGFVMGISSRYLRRVATPIWKAWQIYKHAAAPANYRAAILEVQACEALDWRLACQEWYERRLEKWQKKQATSNVES